MGLSVYAAVTDIFMNFKKVEWVREKEKAPTAATLCCAQCSVGFPV
jgi:hypothetical protein